MTWELRAPEKHSKNSLFFGGEPFAPGIQYFLKIIGFQRNHFFHCFHDSADFVGRLLPRGGEVGSV